MHRQVAKELQYPWRYGQQALDNYRFYTRLHTRLFPYINTYAKLAGNEGLPIIRPLVLMTQDDPNTFGLQHIYLFGNELLVAPIVQPNAVTREVYLPDGAWFDFWTNARHAGRQTITWTDHDPTHIPLFIRDGAVVPMLLTAVDTLCDADYVNNPAVRTLDDGLQVLIYPAGNTSFTLFDESDIRCVANDGTVAVTVTTSARPLLLQLHRPAPASVTRDGAALREAATAAAFDAAPEAWRADAQTRMLFVKFAHSGGSSTIQLS
jgi:alpha-glucosidase (family GH31 glycosyl hydrolase)